jgi:hypothetical protein
MKLTEVTDRKTRKLFLDTARVIYQDDPVWVCPLDRHINNVFDRGTNRILNMELLHVGAHRRRQ